MNNCPINTLLTSKEDTAQLIGLRRPNLLLLISLYVLILVLAGLELFMPHSVRAAGIVGTGTPQSCNEANLNTALSGGGMVSFNCGSDPVTITLSSQKIITTETTIDGGNLVTLSANNDRLFVISTSVTVTVQNLTFDNGYTLSSPGGAIYNLGHLTVINSTFHNNKAGVSNVNSYGGAISCDTSSAHTGTLNVIGSTFVGNSAAQGGAISCNGSFTVSNSTFTGNKGTFSGGAIASNAATITDSTIIGNIGGDGGGIGGIWGSAGGLVTISNSIISGNTGGFGAGISGIYGNKIKVINSSISDNIGSRGGGIYTEYQAEIINTTLSKNRAEQGGGLWLEYLNQSGQITITNSTLISNTATVLDGGGIYNNSEATVNLFNSTLSNNTSPSKGGGIYNSNNARILNIANSTLSANTANSGGGVNNNVNGTVNIINSTLTSNTASTGGGGVYITDNFISPIILKNTIVANNIGGDCNKIATGSDHIINSDGTCGFPATDPKLGLLADNGGPTKTHALLPTSPAINSGDNNICAAAPVSNLDQRGITRPQGTGCDIGAYEAVYLIVNNISDSGSGSLREAILTANATSDIETILFNIPGPGVKTITPLSPLPAIEQPVVIDGTSQTGASCGTSPTTANLLIELNGANAGPSADGLTIKAGNSTVQGLVINQFGGSGLNLTTNGNNLVKCNFIGTNPTGSTGAGNLGDGIIINASSNNHFGQAGEMGSGNLISGNTGIGLRVVSGMGNQAYYNWFGLAANGTTSIKNEDGEVRIAPNGQVKFYQGNRFRL